MMRQSFTITVSLSLLLLGCDRSATKSSKREPLEIPVNVVAANTPTQISPVPQLVQVVNAILNSAGLTPEQRRKQIEEFTNQSAKGSLQDRLSLIRFLDKLNLAELGYDDQSTNSLATAAASDLQKMMDGDSIIALVQTLQNKTLKRTLLEGLAGSLSLSNPKPADYSRLLSGLDTQADRDEFLIDLMITTGNLPAETRGETVQLLASQIRKESTQNPELATIMGSSIFTSMTEFPIPNQNINDVVTTSETFRSDPALFESFVSGFLMSYLQKNGNEASQWLLQQDKDWLGYGAPTVAEYIIRTDKAAGMAWLKKAYPDAKILGATKFTLAEENLR